VFNIATAQANPNFRGTVFELPATKPITKKYVAGAGLSDRTSVVAGDFFHCGLLIPKSRGRGFLLKHPARLAGLDKHGLAGEDSQEASAGGRAAISELLLADDVKSSAPAASSMNVAMPPFVKGRQYRAKELFCRLPEVGFIKPGVTALVDDYSLVTTERPEPGQFALK
jgi:hypothetical protein